MSCTGGGEEDITQRINKARIAFRQLNKIWNSSAFSNRTKIRLYNTLVKPVLLYNSETWRMTETSKKKLDVLQTKCLRQIFKIFWPYVISNEELLKRAGVRNISEEICERRWKWIGHVLRMDQHSHCRTALGWAPEGKRRRGRPRMTWRRTVEKEREAMGWSSWNEARSMAQDRLKWKRYTRALYATGREEAR